MHVDACMYVGIYFLCISGQLGCDEYINSTLLVGRVDGEERTVRLPSYAVDRKIKSLKSYPGPA